MKNKHMKCEIINLKRNMFKCISEASIQTLEEEVMTRLWKSLPGYRSLWQKYKPPSCGSTLLGRVGASVKWSSIFNDITGNF